jgi:ankyrin repeat protein
VATFLETKKREDDVLWRDFDSFQRLLEAGAHPNDGSLHEASRSSQTRILAFLLEKGHDPDYPCDLHEGRTALGEICLKTILHGGDHTSAAYETMKLLIDAPSALNSRTQGKTVLHLALENDQPIEITRILLRFPKIYNEIQTDSEVFIFEDEQGRFCHQIFTFNVIARVETIISQGSFVS